MREERAEEVHAWLFDDADAPDDLTFVEIDKVLDTVMTRILECRKLYPFTKPATTNEALMRRARRLP